VAVRIAISLMVNCETQQQVDELWNKLSAGGRPDRCGRLQDKYGLSWQIVPTALGRLMSGPDDAGGAADVEAGHCAVAARLRRKI